MQPRFVLVPAVPLEIESFRVGVRFYASTASGGFDIYDNQEKIRIKQGFSDRVAGATVCMQMNTDARNPNELFPILGSE